MRRDLEIILAYPGDDWLSPRGLPDGTHLYDVAIIGAGQGGLATAFALRRERVTNIVVLDQMPRGQEGPWVTYSKMWTLRSPKHVTGPDLGIPSLAPRTWFEAMFGEEQWEAMGKWPRTTWQAYLDWYRDVVDIPVRNETRVDDIGPQHGVLRLVMTTPNGTESLFCRKVILATGIEGLGAWWLPPFVRENIPADRWTMCTDDVDSRDFAGRRIAVLGAGATAWDRSADLLENGADAVTMYMRRKQILQINGFRYLEKAGYLRHYASMDDASKWRWMTVVFRFGQPPTQDGVNRCGHFPNFMLHPGASWADARMIDGAVEITATDNSVERFDHLFIGSGFVIDPNLRPELARFADNIALWRDRYVPPPERADDTLGTYPYLNPDLSFVEREKGRTPGLESIYCFNYGATVSNAHSGASVTGMKYGIGPMIHGITKALWEEEEAAHFAALDAWSEIDTDASPVLQRLWKPPA
ncbi:MAG: NAD(P)/FAD-dependent oxidoreductase [Bauldia sp.]|uniref:NAD(P)-binding domain-containing protein n=1 Tax=Bauldia sp. TaxID=2575872 RepID=UPI001DE9693D|nr:NAD(P)/FAD-dependent oxidoreductase [Bauldia sp.]MCB1496962.1 NAD(P)/FAD-dependent oxidoreductase [Bauldia sp.]